jgi:hypothetical protein
MDDWVKICARPKFCRRGDSSAERPELKREKASKSEAEIDKFTRSVPFGAACSGGGNVTFLFERTSFFLRAVEREPRF